RRVGDPRRPDLEAIAQLEPHLVLLNREENRTQDIAWLSERFEVYTSEPRRLADVVDVLRELGRRLDCWEQADARILHVQVQLARIEVESIGRERIRVFYPIWRDPWISINR